MVLYVWNSWREEGPSSRWVDVIKMDLWVIGLGDVVWIHLARDRVQWKAFVKVDSAAYS
jgi:hypothetical protein